MEASLDPWGLIVAIEPGRSLRFAYELPVDGWAQIGIQEHGVFVNGWPDTRLWLLEGQTLVASPNPIEPKPGRGAGGTPRPGRRAAWARASAPGSWRGLVGSVDHNLVLKVGTELPDAQFQPPVDRVMVASSGKDDGTVTLTVSPDLARFTAGKPLLVDR